MQRNTGRHRKPSTASALAARTAVAAGAAAAAVVVSAGAAAAGTAPAGTAPTGTTPTINPFPCTGTPFDTITKSATGSYCGS